MHLSDGGMLLVEVGGLRSTFEREYPLLSKSAVWLSTQHGDNEMMCILNRIDLEAFADESAANINTTPSSKNRSGQRKASVVQKTTPILTASSNMDAEEVADMSFFTPVAQVDEQVRQSEIEAAIVAKRSSATRKRQTRIPVL